jgi:hypothetical protein
MPMSESSRFWIPFSILISVSVGLAAINLNENLRTTLREHLLPNRREVLAKAQGDLVGDGRAFTVLKVKTREALVVEVFENNPTTGDSLFRTRAILPEKREGLFTYKGHTTNLLLLDVDNDKAQEIIVPSFDENLVPRVHIFKFNDGTNSLELLNPDSVKL